MPLGISEPYQRDLLVRLKRGDERAFNALYSAYARPLYLRIVRLVKDRAVADEILQELFVKLWDKRQQIDETKSFRAYLYTIAQNMVYNHFRKLATDQGLIKSLLSELGLGLWDDQDFNVFEQGRLDLIKEAVEQLTPQRKQVFNLCKMEGKSYEETSRIMGVSIATVNSHMTQALKSVKAYVLKRQDLAFLLLSELGFLGLW